MSIGQLTNEQWVHKEFKIQHLTLKQPVTLTTVWCSTYSPLSGQSARFLSDNSRLIPSSSQPPDNNSYQQTYIIYALITLTPFTQAAEMSTQMVAQFPW